MFSPNDVQGIWSYVFVHKNSSEGSLEQHEHQVHHVQLKVQEVESDLYRLPDTSTITNLAG